MVEVADGGKKTPQNWLRLALSLCLKLPGLQWASEPLHIYCRRWKCLLNEAACFCLLSNSTRVHC